MGKDTGSVSANEMGLTLEDLIRRGARHLIQSAIEVEIQSILQSTTMCAHWPVS
jgi:hypothetical protein